MVGAPGLEPGTRAPVPAISRCSNPRYCVPIREASKLLSALPPSCSVSSPLPTTLPLIVDPASKVSRFVPLVKLIAAAWTPFAAKPPAMDPRKAQDMLSLENPVIDFVKLAQGHGVEAGRATSLEEFHLEMTRGLRSEGPYLIEVVF